MMWNISDSFWLTIIFCKDLRFRLDFCGQCLSWSFVKIHVFFSLHWLDVLLTTKHFKALSFFPLLCVSWTDCSDERLGSSSLQIDGHSRDSELPSPTLPIICCVHGSHLKLAMLMLSCNIYILCISIFSHVERFWLTLLILSTVPFMFKSKIESHSLAMVAWAKNLQHDLNLA